MSEPDLDAAIDPLIEQFRKELEAFDKRWVNFFVGCVMKEDRTLDPKQVREIIMQRLNAL